jgi:alpha-1,2-mannosyltransferase
MSTLSRIPWFAGKAASDKGASDQVGRPTVDIPSWLLLPGLIMLGASLLSYSQLVRNYPVNGADLDVYRGALDAFLNGEPVYRQMFTQYHWPYVYPPVTLILLLPLALPEAASAVYVMKDVGVIALFAALWFTTRALSYRGTAGRVGLVAAATAVLVWSEPFQSTFALGQVNILVMLPVVVDLSLPDRSRFKGVGIGLATAAKLLPGLFIVYLILTRRFRAAAVAVGTFLVLNLIGLIVQPQGSYDYWIGRLAFDTHRVFITLGPRYTGNQSLQGLTARLLGTDAQNTPVWMLSVVVTAVAGLALAVWAHRRGEEAMSMVLVGLTTLLISPVSWSHYWVWIAPMLLVLGDLVRRTVGLEQILMAGLAAAAILPFMMWPLHAAPTAPLLPNGLIWAAASQHGVLARIEVDIYVATALGLFVFLALWLRRRRASDRDLTGTTEACAIEPASASNRLQR